MTITISNHAKERMKERLGIKSQAGMARAAQMAWERGKEYSDVKEMSMCHLQGEDRYEGGNLLVRISKNALFFFSDGGVLVTVISLKGNLMRTYSKHYKSHKLKTRLGGTGAYRRPSKEESSYDETFRLNHCHQIFIA